MRIGDVIGTVTLSKIHPAIAGGRLLVVVPLTWAGLKGDPAGREEAVVAYDHLGAGEGAMVSISEWAEASAPFHPETKPLDAYCSAIIDTLELD